MNKLDKVKEIKRKLEKGTMIRVEGDYKQLTERLPLVPIESDDHLNQAHAMLVELAGQKRMTHGESQYFDVLSKLTAEYEKDMFPIERGSPMEAFQYIFEQSGLSQEEMGKIIGCRQSRVSEILTGTRQLSKEQIVNLSAHFKVSTDLFLPKPLKKVG